MTANAQDSSSSNLAKTDEIIAAQDLFFATGVTRSVAFRRQQLKQLYRAIVEHEQEITAALYADFKKPAFETMTSELSVVYFDLKMAMSKVKKWAKKRRVATSFFAQPGLSYIVPEPKGRALVIGPWNYPFQLVMGPLVSAIAAGCCVVAKPSEFAPATAAVIAKIIKATFAPNYVTVVHGGVPETTALLNHGWGHIFFTGSPGVGKIVMAAAAKTLTSVTLELGGKNPAIIDDSAPVAETAQRLVWGKFFNASQTCIAPDYLLVPERMKAELLVAMSKEIEASYGKDPEQSPDFARMISERHLDRLVNLLKGTNVITGGRHNRATRYFAPTIVDGVDLDHPVMQEEIFGPILPIMTYRNLDEALAVVNARPKPLALYVFSRDKAVTDKIMNSVQFGGGCVNTTLMHFISHNLPFGGIGSSGIGSGHGKYGFDAFTHNKGIVVSTFWADLLPKYPPYGATSVLIQRLTRLLMKLPG
ncbi:MAG: aldehyde dehydrogenase family protein [Deltaproteobacteria bacterium]|nr:aldehyde dehydrogenase family protein [Deltaproteobacteria bacterium]